MDRTQDCGSCNRGSTPREGTLYKNQTPFMRFGFYVVSASEDSKGGKL